MYHVERAIILAAGIGERLRPVTYDTPKPLIRVHGRRMIDTLIQSLNRNGIHEIYIVAGYLKERLSALPSEYPGVTLIDNPWYDRCNNIASLYCARAHLENAMILDGDQIVYDDSALSPDFERSGYNAVWTDEPTDEWLLTVENGVITGCSPTGGVGGWQLYSVSRWSAEDGAKLRSHLEIEFAEKQHTQLYWDELALLRYPEEYRLGIRRMCPDDMIEIDALEELAALDPGYAGLLDVR